MNPTDIVIHLSDALAKAEVRPSLGGWLTRYARQVGEVGLVEVIHQDSEVEARYPREMWAGNPILFPLVSFNHLPGADHHYEWNGLRFPLPQHGFARRTPWKVIDQTEASVTVELANDEATLPVYPWNFACRLTYALRNGRLHAHHEVINRSDSPMPFSLGIHPYLRVPGPRSECVVRCPRATRFNPVGRSEEYFTEPFPACDLPLDRDYNATIQLGDFARNECQLVNTANGLALTLNWEEAPVFHRMALWSRTPRDPFFCIEPWSALPNSFSRAEPGEVTVLAPGASWTAGWWLDAGIGPNIASR
jgi:galactose mutarotase-like enzyme